jgi:drug/metabolite transporter (DMT)-like permease
MFALLAGASAATWTVCLKLGSTKISVALGALVVTSAALVANTTALIIMRARGHSIVFQWDAVWLLAIAGVAAAGVDIFTLLAYERGLRITSSLIVGGTSTALVLLVGFVALHEPVTWMRLLALGLIVGGMLLLHAQGG